MWWKRLFVRGKEQQAAIVEEREELLAERVKYGTLARQQQERILKLERKATGGDG